MKKTVLLACTLWLATTLFAQTNDKALAYITAYKEIAMNEMLRSGVPASITLAQGILESSYGESELCKKSNNHFGIKCKENWTGEKTYHDDDTKGECFRVYPTAQESYKDHSDFLKNRPYYAFLFKLDPTDYEGWAKGLKKAGYATEKDYPQKLIKIINDYNLQAYTLLALNKSNPLEGTVTEATAGNTATVQDNTQSAEVLTAIAPQKEDEPAPAERVNTTSPATTTVAALPANTNDKKESKYPEGVFAINHCKVVYAKQGTSVLALANTYNISLAKLMEYNDLPEMDLLDTDRLIFIEPKLKKGANEFHVVQEGETLHDICQTEGVRMASLIEYNKLARDAKPQKGEKLYLRGQQSKTKS
jgi:hypothetical protein